MLWSHVRNLSLLFVFIPVASSVIGQVPLDSQPVWRDAEVGDYSTGMVWRDCNNDGSIDVFFSNGNDIVLAKNTIYLTYGSMVDPTASWKSANNEFSGHCAVGDIDDDGFPDLAVSNYLGPGGWGDPATANVYLNSAGYPSRMPDWYSEEFYSFSCAFGDADGDGDLDLAFATGEPYSSIFERDLVYYNVDGTLQATAGWQSAQTTGAMDVAWGDIDNDGDLDLAFCCDNSPTSIYYNHGDTIETWPSWQASFVEPANTLIFGDINDDGWLDLVVAYNHQLGGGGQFRAFFNNGAGTLFTSPGWESSTGGLGSALAMYDYDNDGDADLAAGRWWDRPRIYENLGDTFTSAPVWRGGIASVVEELAWVDMDGDGVEILAETLQVTDGRKLFYTGRRPLYALDSLFVDGQKLTFADYCYDPFYGWVSLAAAPAYELVMFYRYSFKNDLAMSNWDSANYVYANTSEPFVRFAADTTIGWAPLVVQFTDSSPSAAMWSWQFGDGDTSSMQNPLHTYSGGGTFDVYLGITTPGGPHNRTWHDMIVLLADTLFMPAETVVYIGGQTITIPVYLRNAHPVREITLPLTWGGDVNLSYDDFDIASCRTDYFEDVRLLAYDPSNRKMAFRLTANAGGGAQPLPPGYGPIINLHFSLSGGPGAAGFDTVSHHGYSLDMIAPYLQYQPYVTDASMWFARCGDTDGNGIGPQVDDLSFLVDYLFLSGPPPPVPDAANVDGYPGVNVADLAYLVDYLFLSGPPPDCP